MARALNGFVNAGPWEQGKIIMGYLVSSEVPPNAKSKKYVFDVTGKADYVACWGTAALDGRLTGAQTGQYIVIQCLGKGDSKKGAFAWKFGVWLLTSDEEVARAIEKRGADVLKHASPEETPPTDHAELPF